MKVYVDELPKSCQKCPFCEYFEKDAHGKGKHEVACYFNGSLGNILYGNQTSPKTCPLESIADHDKKVRAEVVAENKSLKERWEKLRKDIEKSIESDNKYLKSFPNNMNFENYRTAKRVILETIKELEEEK